MTSDPAPRRFLIVAGCFADASPAIVLAAALAHDRRGALVGVLAREPAAADAEGAPLVTMRRRRAADAAPSAAPNPPNLTRESLSLAYAADARAFSTRLATLAAQARVNWHFHTDSGMSVDLAFRLREPGDTVLLGYRRLLHTRGPLVALCRDEDARTQDMAAALALALRRRMLVLPAESADDPERIEQLCATALIVAPEMAHRPDRLAALVEAARCPVMIAPDDAAR